MMSTEAPVGRLVVCPTPIGNLEDITLRALSELAGADVIACEDTRHSRVLLDRHGIGGRVISLHEHNEAQRAGEIAGRIAAGEVVALISDAGTPLVSDPGYALVRECTSRGLPVEVLPGASSVITALVASALPCGRWRFVGFLPRTRGEILSLLQTQETTVAFESPRRLAGTLALIAAAEPGRELAVCRELTKLHEDVRRGSASELAAHYAASPARGEVVLVCGPAPPAPADGGAAAEAVSELVAAGARPRAAAAAVARLTGLRANELYRGLLEPDE